jgi:hypothetical protein
MRRRTEAERMVSEDSHDQLSTVERIWVGMLVSAALLATAGLFAAAFVLDFQGRPSTTIVAPALCSPVQGFTC